MWQRKLDSIRSYLKKFENRIRTYGRHENRMNVMTSIFFNGSKNKISINTIRQAN